MGSRTLDIGMLHRLSILFLFSVVISSPQALFAACPSVNYTTHDANYRGEECITSGKISFAGLVHYNDGAIFQGKAVRSTQDGVTTVDHDGAVANTRLSGAIASSVKRDAYGNVLEFAEQLTSVQEHLGPDTSFVGIKNRYVGKDSNGAAMAPGDVQEVRSGVVTSPQVRGTLNSVQLVDHVGNTKMLKEQWSNLVERLAPDVSFHGVKSRYMGQDVTGGPMAIGDVRELRSGLVYEPQSLFRIRMDSNLLMAPSGLIKSGTVTYATTSDTTASGAVLHSYWIIGGKKFSGTFTVTYAEGTNPTVTDNRVPIP